VVRVDVTPVAEPAQPLVRDELADLGVDVKAEGVELEPAGAVEPIAGLGEDPHVLGVRVPVRPSRGFDEMPPDRGRRRVDDDLVVGEQVGVGGREVGRPVDVARQRLGGELAAGGEEGVPDAGGR
jgi:hypothetical protein